VLRLATRSLALSLMLLAATANALATASADELTEEQQQEIARLEALGYLAGTGIVHQQSGVTAHDPTRAHAGLNLVVSGHGAEAVLVDMKGDVVHRWARRFDEIWIGRKELLNDSSSPAHYWRRAFPQPNGDLLVIFEAQGLARLSRDSKLIWKRAIKAHHDLDVTPGGDIVILTRRARMIQRIDRKKPTLEDFVVILGSDGTEKSKTSVIRAFSRSRYAWMLKNRRVRSGDILHTNGLEILNKDAARHNPAFTAGRILLSIRDLDAIAVLDMELGEIVWAHQGAFSLQHDPRIVDDGHLLLFDNSGLGLESRVLELDPRDGRIVWAYRGPEDKPYYSDCCGTSQRLPNGNTLINETTAGRSFEVTREGEIVWEFINPYRIRVSEDSPAEVTARLFDLIRLPLDYGSSWLGAKPLP
jgi:hypothetical protein